MQFTTQNALPTYLSKSSQDVLSELLITQLIEEDVYGHPEDFDTFQLNQAILESELLQQRLHKSLPVLPSLQKGCLNERIAFDAVYARDLHDEEQQILMDEEYAQRLQDAEDTMSVSDTPESQSYVPPTPSTPLTDSIPAV